MRKIEQQMIAAIRGAKNWHGSNTEVRTNAPHSMDVYLHGHLIARVFVDRMVNINLCGYNTPTTRSRLSSILRTFVPGCCGVGTKLGQPSIRFMDSSKDRDIASNGWIKV